MIVVDASAAVLGLLNRGDARHRLATDDVAVPHLVDSEILHALRSQVFRGGLDADDALWALNRWVRLGIRRFAVQGLLFRMWELRHNVSAYDATYVALAEAVDCALLTADVRLAAAPGVRCQVIVVRH